MGTRDTRDRALDKAALLRVGEALTSIRANASQDIDLVTLLQEAESFPMTAPWKVIAERLLAEIRSTIRELENARRHGPSPGAGGLAKTLLKRLEKLK